MSNAYHDQNAGASRQRHFGLDWLRAGAFVLLIFHHVGMVFVPGTWLVKVADPVEAVAWPMIVIQPWRMPLLFAVSGYASWQLLSRTRDVPTFLRSRSLRLLLPILFGIILVTPPEIWVSMVQFHGYRGSLAEFWLHDWFRFGNVAGVMLPSLGHLWFLAYLWTYTMVLGLALIVSRGGFDAWLSRIAAWVGEGGRLVWAPLMLLLPLRLSLLFTVSEQSGLLHDWVSDVTFLPCFLLGFTLAANAGLWRSVRAAAPQAAIVAGGASLVLLAIQYRYPEYHSHVVQAADRAAQLALAWSMILLLLAGADRYANRDHPVRSKLNEAIFPLYIAHQTIIVVAAWWLLPVGMNYWLLGLSLIAITFAGSWLFYEIARRAGPLRPLLGLSPAKKPGVGSQERSAGRARRIAREHPSSA